MDTEKAIEIYNTLPEIIKEKLNKNDSLILQELFIELFNAGVKMGKILYKK